jgi:hypothetical protein
MMVNDLIFGSYYPQGSMVFVKKEKKRIALIFYIRQARRVR